MVPSLALLCSPLLGSAVWQPVARVLADQGWHTVICVAASPVQTGQDALDAFVATLPREQSLVVVPHSNAGVYVPELVMQRRVVGAVFVDAVLPEGGGDLPLAPPAFLELLRKKADDDGLLPVWTGWWDEADLVDLLPDARTRAQVEVEQQRLPLSYFESKLSIPTGWDDDLAGAYLAFGDTYATERDQAAQRRWPVSTLSGGHLHMLVDPERVAAELVALLSGLGFDSPHS